MRRISKPIWRWSPLRVRAGILLLCLFLPLGVAHAGFMAHGGKLRKKIEQLEQQYRRALLTGNIVTMRKMLASDYIGIEPNGIIKTKNETLADWKHHAVVMKQLVLSDVHVRIFGDTAVVTSRARVVGNGPDGSLTGEYRYTRVYHRESSGRWQIVNFEANRITRHHSRGT